MQKLMSITFFKSFFAEIKISSINKRSNNGSTNLQASKITIQGHHICLLQ